MRMQGWYGGSRMFIAWTGIHFCIQGNSHDLYQRSGVNRPRFFCKNPACLVCARVRSCARHELGIVLMRAKCLKVLLLASIAVFTVSCESSSFSSKTYRTIETNRTIVSEPLVVEYDTIFNERIYDTLIYKSTESSRSNNYLYEKQLAVADCCKNNNCDILVNVSYDIKDEDGKIRVIISGLPARYKRIRPATKDDLWILQFINNE